MTAETKQKLQTLREFTKAFNALETKSYFLETNEVLEDDVNHQDVIRIFFNEYLAGWKRIDIIVPNTITTK